MYNWSVDTQTLKKNEESYTIWRLEQLVNFGLAGERLDAGQLRKYWSKLRLDPLRRKYLSLLLDEK